MRDRVSPVTIICNIACFTNEYEVESQSMPINTKPLGDWGGVMGERGKELFEEEKCV